MILDALPRQGGQGAVIFGALPRQGGQGAVILDALPRQGPGVWLGALSVPLLSTRPGPWALRIAAMARRAPARQLLRKKMSITIGPRELLKESHCQLQWRPVAV